MIRKPKTKISRPAYAMHEHSLSNHSVDDFWNAVRRRDAAFDGRFFYSVATTGVYCRPSCGSRLANRSNVQFHASCADAERAGFRPCKRCKPDAPALAQINAAMVAEACRRIEAADIPPTFPELARELGVSAHHFHRIFKKIVGVTPKGYADAQRQIRLRQSLTRSKSVTKALYEAGFNSSSRFYESADGVLGMTPADYRAGGKNTTMRFAVGECSLGSILVAASDKGITAIQIGEDAGQLVRDLQDRFPHANLIGADSTFEDVMSKVVGMVEAPRIGLELPLDVRGTAFQHRVWQALREIPSGSTVTYRDLAERIGMPKAVRAVASACAANNIAVAIPCHRVVRTDGSLSGYRWGVERKKKLIEYEAKR